MQDLLTRVLRLRRPENEEEVQALINDLGPSPSIPVLEAVLKHYKNMERGILTKDLLEWMYENDMQSFENEEVKVSISTYVSAKIENPDAAFAWLTQNQYADLIKDSLDFPKGELTPEIESILETQGVSYTKKSGIHPQSLKKVMSDRLKAGDDVPGESDGFIINYFDECKIKEK